MTDKKETAEKENRVLKAYDKKVIAVRESEFHSVEEEPPFNVKYIISEEENSFRITLIKSEKKADRQIEKSVINIYDSKEKSLKIYYSLVNNKVTPMCLEDAVSEFI